MSDAINTNIIATPENGYKERVKLQSEPSPQQLTHGVIDYNTLFGSLFEEHKGILEENGLDEFDMIFIDGKSVRDHRGLNSAQLQKEQVGDRMKCAVLGAIMDSKKVELCRVENENGGLKILQPTMVKNGTEGSRSIFDGESANERSARHTQIQKSIAARGNLVRELKPLQTPYRDASEKNERAEKRNISLYNNITVNENGAETTLTSSDIDGKYASNGDYFGTIVKAPFRRMGMTNLYMMTKGGYSIKDICEDSDRLNDEKSKYGREFYEMTMAASDVLMKVGSKAEAEAQKAFDADMNEDKYNKYMDAAMEEIADSLTKEEIKRINDEDRLNDELAKRTEEAINRDRIAAARAAKVKACNETLKTSPECITVQETYLEMERLLVKPEIPTTGLTSVKEYTEHFSELVTLHNMSMDFPEYIYKVFPTDMGDNVRRELDQHRDTASVINGMTGPVREYIQYAGTDKFFDLSIAEPKDIAAGVGYIKGLRTIENKIAGCTYFSEIVTASPTELLNDGVVPFIEALSRTNEMKTETAKQWAASAANSIKEELSRDAERAKTPDTFLLPGEKGIDVKTYGQKAEGFLLSTAEKGYGVKNFNLTFGRAFEGEQRKLINETGIDEFDLIFIDGKSVKERFGQKSSSLSHKDAHIQMKCMVIGAMADADKKIEICSLEKVKGVIKPKDEVRSISADIKLNEKKAKPRTIGERFWNLLGRWKAPETQREKAAKLYENDKEKPVRKARALNSIGGRIKEMQPIKGLRDKCKAANNKFNRIMDHNDKQFTGYLEEGGKKLSCEDASRFYGSNDVIANSNSRPHTRCSIIGLYALSRGLPMEALCSDDSKYDADKRKYGKEFYDMLKKASVDVKEATSKAKDGIDNKLKAREDGKNASSAVDQVREAFLKMGDTLYDIKIPVTDITDKNQLIDKHTEISVITGIGLDYEHNFDRINEKLTVEQESNQAQNCEVGLKIIRTCGGLRSFVESAAKDGFGDKYIGDVNDMADVMASIETLPLIKDFYKDCEDFSEAEFTDEINKGSVPHDAKHMEFITEGKGNLAKMLCEQAKLFEKGGNPDVPSREKSSVNEITKELFDLKDHSIGDNVNTTTKNLSKSGGEMSREK